MEQTHLICSADAKTWDEVTRDTSYIGKMCLMAVMDDVNNSSTASVKHNKFRGSHNTNRIYHNKDFAISYDRFVCLRTGVYTLNRTLRHSGYTARIQVNNNEIAAADAVGSDTTISQITVYLQRGDVVKFVGGNGTDESYNFSSILRAD